MIGRELDPALRGTLTNPNKITDELLAELRGASNELEAMRRFRHYASPTCRPFAQDFVLSVVLGPESAETWRRGGALTVDWNLVELLTKPDDELLAPLGTTESSELVRLPVNRGAWADRSHDVGAPAVLRPELDYSWSGVPHAVRVERDIPTVPIADPQIAVRRWIATRLAMVLEHAGVLQTVDTEDAALRVVGVSSTEASASALSAVRGLLAEVPLLRTDQTLVPGFCGSDESFR